MQLLKPKKVIVRSFSDITKTDMLKLLKAGRQKKYNFLEVAYDVEELARDKFNVRMEYMVKD